MTKRYKVLSNMTKEYCPLRQRGIGFGDKGVLSKYTNASKKWHQDDAANFLCPKWFGHFAILLIQFPRDLNFSTSCGHMTFIVCISMTKTQLSLAFQNLCSLKRCAFSFPIFTFNFKIKHLPPDKSKLFWGHFALQFSL